MSIIKKTNRKNKTGYQVIWPSGYFTTKQLFALNSECKEITLRSRKDAAVSDNTVACIGTIHQPKGRPTDVFALLPITNELLVEARNNKVVLNDTYNSVIVMNVDQSNIPAVPATVEVMATEKVDTTTKVNA
jgi:hypothetical protein